MVFPSSLDDKICDFVSTYLLKFKKYIGIQVRLRVSLIKKKMNQIYRLLLIILNLLLWP